MLIKQIFAGFILVAIFWSTSAHVVSAAVSAEQNRALLLVQIERLLTEVLRLQAILDSRTDIVTPAFSTSYTPYKTVFFPLTFKSIYLVENSQLFNTDKVRTVR